jgi:hypothetical protein
MNSQNTFSPGLPHFGMMVLVLYFCNPLTQTPIDVMARIHITRQKNVYGDASGH